MLLPSLIFPPHSSPSCQFSSPPCSFPLEKSAWLLLCDIFLFVRQPPGCLYWIISQSKSRARGNTGWGQVQATSKLGSLRHQKYKWTDRLHGGQGGILFAIERKAQSHSAELYCWQYYNSHIKVCLQMKVIMSLVIEAVMTHGNFISSKIFCIRHQVVRDTLDIW